MSLAIKLPPHRENRLDTELLRGNGEEYFKGWQRKHKPENVDTTFVSRGVGRTAINSYENSIGFTNAFNVGDDE